MKLLMENWRRFLLKEANLINSTQLGIQVHASQEYVGDAIRRFQAHQKPSSFQDPARRKPFGFYTSTIKELGNDQYSSSWNDFLNSSDGRNIRNTQSAILLKPQQRAKILQVSSVEEYDEILKQFPSTNNKKIDWDKVAQNYDAIHFEESIATQIGFDVEQTVWFNTSVLEIIPARNENQINKKIISTIKEELKSLIKSPSSYELLNIYGATPVNDIEKISKEFRTNLIKLVEEFIKNPNANLQDLSKFPELPQPFYQRDSYTPQIIELIKYYKNDEENVDYYDLKFNLLSDFS